MGERIAVIDFETTDIYRPEVLQAAIIDEREFPLLNRLYCPERVSSWPDAQRVHGISPEDVKGRPSFAEDVRHVERLLNAADIVLAYNAAFELGVLRSYGAKLKPKYFVDPMLMFARVAGEWNPYRNDYRWQKLTTAAAHYGYSFDAHDALADVKATLYIYRRMIADGVKLVTVPIPEAAA